MPPFPTSSFNSRPRLAFWVKIPRRTGQRLCRRQVQWKLWRLGERLGEGFFSSKGSYRGASLRDPYCSLTSQRDKCFLLLWQGAFEKILASWTAERGGEVTAISENIDGYGCFRLNVLLEGANLHPVFTSRYLACDCTFLSLVTLSLQTFDFRSRCNILCFQWVCLCTSVVSTLAPAWHVQYLVAFVLNRCCTLWLWHVFVCGCSSAFAGSCVVAHAVLWSLFALRSDILAVVAWHVQCLVGPSRCTWPNWMKQSLPTHQHPPWTPSSPEVKPKGLEICIEHRERERDKWGHSQMSNFEGCKWGGKPFTALPGNERS